ncbi:MAG TPA: hypothetical protein VFJ46_07295 [Xanthobacteraceae bacterium]|nr:hypothetical protein [Xanthobacteraceae bacterium]
MVDQPAYRREAVAAPMYISWGAVIAGAIAASALTFVLITFGAAIGLAIASPSATWRDTSVALALLSGLWLLLTAIASFALGGYLAGRLRATGESTTADEVELRDGLHGLLVWGLAILIGAALALGLARTAAAPATGNVLAPTASTAEPLLAFELDRLFRADRRPGEAVEPDVRAQAARIITTSLGHADMAAEDRAYLVRLVMARTGLAQPDAERRVTEVIAQARRAIRRARANAVILAFMAAASLLAGAAVAWFAAGFGGRHRDGEAVPAFWLNRPGVPVRGIP